jgi:prepilin-type N-terminal cleavage/methylation domain-containing protein
MKSPTPFKDKSCQPRRLTSGFTLIEILVVVGVLVLIFAIGVFIDSSNLGRETLAREQETLITILHRARSRAMNNIYATSHGIHIGADEYVLFRGASFDPAAATNENIERNGKININTAGIDANEVVFQQLSGNTLVMGDIVLNDPIRAKKITIHQSGLIDW